MSNDAEPLVSIVVPSWQQGRFLRGCLESLLRQTYSRLEVVVQDNLSSDETDAVLRDYAPRLAQVVREKDAGQADALRRGFARCRGEILGWLNADDLLMPGAVAAAVAAFASGGGTAGPPAVVYGHCAQLDEEGQFLRYFHEIQAVGAHELFNLGDFIAQPSAFFRRALYEEAGGLDARLRYALDWELWCRLAAVGGTFRFVDQVWAGARLYGNTKTASGGLGRLREIYAVNRRYQSTRLPLATLGFIYGAFFRRRLAWLDRPLKRVWAGLSGDNALLSSQILGLAHGNTIVRPVFALRFPVYRSVSGARLVLVHTGAPAAWPQVEATLNGAPGVVETGAAGGTLQVSWRFEPPVQMDVVEAQATLAPYASGPASLRLARFSLSP